MHPAALKMGGRGQTHSLEPPGEAGDCSQWDGPTGRLPRVTGQ